jgi:protein-glutamine gamma-glutamyltransferase
MLGIASHVCGNKKIAMATSNKNPNGSLNYSMRALGGRLGAQWEKDRRDTLFLMLGAFLSAFPHMFHLPLWTSVGFLMLYAWRLGLVLSGRWLPRDSVRWAAAIACIIAVFAQYKTLLGRDAGVALLVLFLGLKLMEMKARRDLFVVIFLCFFILITSFFYSQSIWAAISAILAVWALLAAMLTMHYGPNETPVPERFKSIGIIMLQAAPLAAALFFLFPRVSTPLWGLPSDAHSGRTGMSDTMAPGSVSNLRLSQEIAFRAKFDGAWPETSQMYWRGPVLGDFDGKQWQPLKTSLTPRVQANIQPLSRKPISYTMTLEPHNQRWLFALDAPSSINNPSLSNLGAQLNPDAVLQAKEPITSRVRYSLDASLNYSLGIDDEPLSRQNWLDLPPSFNPRTLALAAQWQNETPDPGKLVQRALDHIRSEPFYYTFKPPLLGRNSVDEFLFTTRSGFCEHYSSAFVVLMRALDIPARVVTGYQGGERNPVDDYWIIKQADAHAWAEVWLAGKGWVRVDPTSAIAPERIERGAQPVRFGDRAGETLKGAGLMDKLKYKLDSVTNSWNQWVLNYDRNAQKKLLELLGFDFDEWREVAGLLAGVLGLLIAIAALVTLRPRLPKDPVERIWKALTDKLESKGLQRYPNETSLQWLSRVGGDLPAEQQVLFAAICKEYNHLRYEVQNVKSKDVRNLRVLATKLKP